MANLVIFEQHVEDHGPLTRTRPVCELRCGAMSLGERLARRYGGATVFHVVRPYLAPVHAELLAERGRDDGAVSGDRSVRVNQLAEALQDDVVLVDGAVLATKVAQLPDLQGPDEAGVVGDVVNHRTGADGSLAPVRRDGGRVVYLRLTRPKARALLEQVGPDLGALLRAAGGMPSVAARQLDDGELPVMTYPWTLLDHNGAAIAEDYELYRGRNPGGLAIDPATVCLDHGRRIEGIVGDVRSAAPVYIGRGSSVGAFVSFDVTEGPVIVDDRVTIESHCHLKGPTYVGPGSTLWAFADVKEGCSLGPWSRVCGQVEEVIFQGYMHKFHVGFVGHSYLGEGVNLGDQTVTSNLKNDRTPVDVHLAPETDRHINTGSLYCGALIGDGAATGTNTNLITGAVVEPLSNIVSAVATPKYVNGFLYQGRHLPSPFGKAYGALRILLEQRMGRALPPGHEKLYRYVYDEMKATRRALRRRASP